MLCNENTRLFLSSDADVWPLQEWMKSTSGKKRQLRPKCWGAETQRRVHHKVLVFKQKKLKTKRGIKTIIDIFHSTAPKEWKVSWAAPNIFFQCANPSPSPNNNPNPLQRTAKTFFHYLDNKTESYIVTQDYAKQFFWGENGLRAVCLTPLR